MLALLLALAPGQSVPTALELEAGVGIAQPYEPGGIGFGDRPTGDYSLAPALQGRVALDFGQRLALSMSFLSVQGGEGNPRAPDPSAFAAWAALASVRFHTAGDLQLWLEWGGGLGHLIRLQQYSAFEHPAFSGVTDFTWRLAGGMRVRAAPWMWLGAELSLLNWNGVFRPPGAGSDGGAGAQAGMTVNALLLMVSAAFTTGL